MMNGVASPSDVLKDYTYGYENDELDQGPTRSVGRNTAPLAISRKGKSGRSGGSGGGEESPGLGNGKNLDWGRFDDGDEDMR